MKKLFYVLIVIGLLGVSLPAQELAALQTQLKRLELQILKVHSLADRYQNPQAQKLISRAEAAFSTAKDLASNRRFAEARAKFLEARELLEQSARILLYKPVITLKLELDKLIHDAEQATFDNSGVEGQYLLNRAKSFQSKALRAFNDGNYVEGEKYFRIARFYARKSLQLSNTKAGSTDWTTEFMDQYNSQQNLYQELENSVDQTSDAAEILKKTKYYLQQAKENFDRKNRKEALTNLQIAERFLLRTIDLNRQDDASEETIKDESLVSLRQFLDGVGFDIDRNESSEARNLLRKANHFYEGAVRDIENGRLKAAQNKIRVAQRLGARALRLTDQNTAFTGEGIPDRIAELNRILELQQLKIETSGNKALSELQQQAQNLLRDARTEIEKGNMRPAFIRAELALRIVNRIEYLLKFSSESGGDADEFGAKFQKIENDLSLIINSSRVAESDKKSAATMGELLQTARKYNENGDSRTASELLNIIQIQLNEIIKNARK